MAGAADPEARLSDWPAGLNTPITTNVSQNGGEVAGFSWCTCLV